MKVKTRLKSGGMNNNHNETLVRDIPKARGLKVKTHLKAGAGPVGQRVMSGPE